MPLAVRPKYLSVNLNLKSKKNPKMDLALPLGRKRACQSRSQLNHQVQQEIYCFKQLKSMQLLSPSLNRQQSLNRFQLKSQ